MSLPEKHEEASAIVKDALAAVVRVTGSDRALMIILAFTTGLDIGASDPELAQALQANLFRDQRPVKALIRQQGMDQVLAHYRERMGLS